jgi:hypothetical protein
MNYGTLSLELTLYNHFNKYQYKYKTIHAAICIAKGFKTIETAVFMERVSHINRKCHIRTFALFCFIKAK